MSDLMDRSREHARQAAKTYARRRVSKKVFGWVAKALIGKVGFWLALVIALLLLVIVAVGGSSDDEPATVTPGGISPAAGQLNTTAIPNPDWVPWVLKAGSMCPEVPAPIIAAQIETESSWNPNAQSSTVPGLHTGGAQGLTQFMPPTWAAIGQDDDGNGTVSPFDPGDAIMAQGRYMCQIVGELKAVPALAGGDLLGFALAGYNAGPNRVKEFGGIPPFTETQAYVPKIKTLAAEKYTAAGAPAGPPTIVGGTQIPIPAGYDITGTITAPNPTVATAIVAGLAQLGTPYSWGGGGTAGPGLGICAADAAWNDCNIKGFDCSGLMQYMWGQAGISIAKYSQTQFFSGQQIPWAQKLPGDMTGTPTHITMYIGTYNGVDWTIEAPYSGGHVRLAPVRDHYDTVSRVWS